ncbi:hypothetical protein LCGC14_2497840 [marine sediment metagenome]|uniref:Uncharacterized protein n=1 Tax=marine sediment metagenome TaxID=412755 RepID=A0A0F9DWN7_9ZZZZ|nr:hypothetical protein [bacterium]
MAALLMTVSNEVAKAKEKKVTIRMHIGIHRFLVKHVKRRNISLNKYFLQCVLLETVRQQKD